MTSNGTKIQYTTIKGTVTAATTFYHYIADNNRRSHDQSRWVKQIEINIAFNEINEATQHTLGTRTLGSLYVLVAHHIPLKCIPPEMAIAIRLKNINRSV